jgi:hypothetical protein
MGTESAPPDRAAAIESMRGVGKVLDDELDADRDRR